MAANTIILLASALAAARDPAGCAAGKVVGLNLAPGGVAYNTQGCAERCVPHPLNKAVQRALHAGGGASEGDPAVPTSAQVDAAVAESDFVMVATYQGFNHDVWRFLPVPLESGAPDPRVVDKALDPQRHVTVSKHIDPRAHAGSTIYKLAEHGLNITMLYSLRANVPTTFVPPDFFETVSALPLVPASARDSRRHGGTGAHVLWVSSACRPPWRQSMVAALSEHIAIDRRGACLNNAPKIGWENALDTFADYKFVLSIENAVEDDYASEKFFKPYRANTVPIYYGAPNAADFAPAPGSFIDVRDFASPAALAAYLERVASDDAEYAKFFAWRRPGAEAGDAPAPLRRAQQLSGQRRGLFCDVCDCVCDAGCRQRGGDIHLTPPRPQVGAWDAKAPLSPPRVAGSKDNGGVAAAAAAARKAAAATRTDAAVRGAGGERAEMLRLLRDVEEAQALANRADANLREARLAAKARHRRLEAARVAEKEAKIDSRDEL